MSRQRNEDERKGHQEEIIKKSRKISDAQIVLDNAVSDLENAILEFNSSSIQDSSAESHESHESHSGIIERNGSKFS